MAAQASSYFACECWARTDGQRARLILSHSGIRRSRRLLREPPAARGRHERIAPGCVGQSKILTLHRYNSPRHRRHTNCGRPSNLHLFRSSTGTIGQPRSVRRAMKRRRAHCLAQVIVADLNGELSALRLPRIGRDAAREIAARAPGRMIGLLRCGSLSKVTQSAEDPRLTSSGDSLAG